MKNTQDRIDGMSGLAEEKISEPKGIVIETINETSRENEKYEENIGDLIGQLELAQYAYNWSPKSEREREGGSGKASGEIMTQNVPNLMKALNTIIQEHKQTSSTRNMMEINHIIVN